MKSLILLATLTTPAVANSVLHLNDWTVITNNGKRVAFSSPLKSSSNQFYFDCDTNYQTCYLSNNRSANDCDTDQKRALYFRLHTVADKKSDLDFIKKVMVFCIDHKWINNLPGDLAYVQQIFHSNFPRISIWYREQPNNATEYSTIGAAQAIDIVLGRSNNFDQEQP